MDEKSIYEAFGLEPEEDGAEVTEDEEVIEDEQPGSDEATDDEDTDSEEDGEEVTDEEVIEDEDSDEAEDGDDAGSAAPMDKAERARQAAARRARERQAAIDEALARGRAEERERLNNLLKSSGMKDPLNKNASIEDVDGFERYVNAARGAREELRDRRVGSGQGSAEDIREIVSEAVERHPAIIRARELEAEAEMEQQKAMAERVRAKAEAQIREIAETKMPDLNAASLEAATEMIKGTARSMGVEVVD